MKRGENEMWTDEREGAPTDLDHGQIVIVAARWILITAGLVLLIAVPTKDVAALRLQVALILALGIGNFFIHAKLLRGRSVPAGAAYLASAVDLGVISILIMSQAGDSPLYVFYFPALLALSVAFEPVITAFYAIVTASLYAVIAMSHAPVAADAAPVVAMRVVMLVGVACCGAVYWLVERDRRRRIADDSEATAPASEGRWS